jgi:YD repeat-containing protein
MEEEEHDERPAVSQWRLNWFGQGRRRRRTPTDGGLLTELTEPLIASDREGSQPSAVEVDQNALEEVTFAASPTATQTGAGPAMTTTTTTTAATAVAPQIDPPATSAEV